MQKEVNQKNTSPIHSIFIQLDFMIKDSVRETIHKLEFDKISKR